ncbi:MAG TPA: S46 family peptidase [Clostridiaceae bacterium]|jgi:S1-C subfamily serine protease|nr:S46 family peptidase [Clostridiaceae bacterium]
MRSISETINSISLLQLTSILQVGIISATLLFSGIPNPTNFILDLFINGGSSGSPLFTRKGEVIGIVFATRQHINASINF